MPEKGDSRVNEIQERFRCSASSSFDDEHASALASGENAGLFWTSTGLFPQQVCVDILALTGAGGWSVAGWSGLRTGPKALCLLQDNSHAPHTAECAVFCILANIPRSFG